MARRSSKGKCCLCGGIFGKGAMRRHLEKCRSEQKPASSKAQPTKTFHVVVEGYGLPMYWLHLEVPAQAELSNLDQFLRLIWLECCGHLSAFTIDRQTFNSYVDDDFGFMPFSMPNIALPGMLLNGNPAEANGKAVVDDEYDGTMDIAVEKVLAPGKRFRHEYDFGSTTELVLKVVNEYERRGKKREIKLLARNLPPEIPCSSCGKPATKLCGQCIYDDAGFACAECAAVHKCGEEMMLPVVNSPRMGICGYDGELDEWQT